uniref:Uncharacterized protein n=1 Tax=Molossus molossus TaxID=27622 RepID=A0A7J8J0Q7_MOLMO|nr:hypothetical protein HJG59_010426 [Molossus molossus]
MQPHRSGGAHQLSPQRERRDVLLGLSVSATCNQNIPDCHECARWATPGCRSQTLPSRKTGRSKFWVQVMFELVSSSPPRALQVFYCVETRKGFQPRALKPTGSVQGAHLFHRSPKVSESLSRTWFIPVPWLDTLR